MGWTITSAEGLEEAVFKLRQKIVQKIRVQEGMFVIDVGCGQGGLTAVLSKAVGDQGKVLGVDVSTEYFDEFTENVAKWGVKERVSFVLADVANLNRVIDDGVADMVVGYRFLEELKHAEDMGKIVKEVARIAKKGGKICLIELCTNARNEAEKVYIRLHKESGDSLFEPQEVIDAFKRAKLAKIQVEKFDTDVWFSPDVAKQDLGFAQLWFDQDVEERLGSLIDRYGMKYPMLLIFSGVKA